MVSDRWSLSARRMRRPAVLVLAVASTVGGLMSGPASARPLEMHRAATVSVESARPVTVSVAPAAKPAAKPAAGPAATSRLAACSRRNGRPFTPRSISLPAIGRRQVLALPRTGRTPGTPPLTTAGKSQMAWDRPGPRPGARLGHVLMNAHTWPDGSALGDAMNRGLRVGGLIKVYGPHGKVQCYRVAKRVVAKPSRRLVRMYYGTNVSAPRLVIVTCAGVRRGPGDWSHRSLWFARPVR